jgi:hypothetical protein
VPAPFISFFEQYLFVPFVLHYIYYTINVYSMPIRNITNTFITAFILLPLVAGAAVSRSTLKREIARKRISISAVSRGGYCGECLNVRLGNTTNDTIFTTIDPGLIFNPADKELQPLIVWGGDKILLLPHHDTNIALNTFCGNLDAHCPSENIKYTFSRQADSNLVKTLKYTRERKLPADLTQRAVWYFTNHTNINLIYSSVNMEQTDILGKYVASLTNVPIPKYYKYIPQVQQAGQPLLNKKEEKIIVPVKWKQGDYKQMYVTIYKANGDVYKRIEGGQIIDKYGVSCPVTFRRGGDLNGQYKVVAADNTKKVWYEQEVIVDFD